MYDVGNGNYIITQNFKQIFQKFPLKTAFSGGHSPQILNQPDMSPASPGADAHGHIPI